MPRCSLRRHRLQLLRGGAGAGRRSVHEAGPNDRRRFRRIPNGSSGGRYDRHGLELRHGELFGGASGSLPGPWRDDGGMAVSAKHVLGGQAALTGIVCLRFRALGWCVRRALRGHGSAPVVGSSGAPLGHRISGRSSVSHHRSNWSADRKSHCRQRCAGRSTPSARWNPCRSPHADAPVRPPHSNCVRGCRILARVCCRSNHRTGSRRREHGRLWYRAVAGVR